ncbi:MAG: glycosyltransferase family 4 protein [Bacteroidota bacterium]
MVGGGERVLISTVNQLVLNYEVTIYTYSSKSTFYKISPNVNIVPLGLKKSRFYFLRMIQPLFFLRKLRKNVKKDNVDILIAFSDIGAIFVYLSFLFSFNLRIKKFVWLHNSYFQPIAFFIKALRIRILKSFDKIIVLNKMDKKIYEEKMKSQKVILMPNPKTFTLDHESTLKNKKIISVGRLHKDKGFQYLIKAGNIIFKQKPDWKLSIIGQDRGEKQYLRSIIKEHKLENNIIIEPPTSKIEEKFLEASIFVLTSLHEAFGLVLIEASEAGLPLVAFNSPGGISDIVINKKNGYLVDQFNIDELAKRIIMLIGSYELRQNMGREAKIIAQNYKIENIISQWHNILN